MESTLVNIESVGPVPFSTDQYAELQVSTPVQVKKASKRPRNGSASGNDANRREYYEWSHGAVHSLLDIYEVKYSSLQRGNLRGRHWHEVAQHVTSREDGTKSAKTSKQCKMKIENLKRRYKMEKTHRIGNPALAGNNRWPYYDRLDGMLGFTPKALAGSQRDCADTLSGSEPLSSQEAIPKSKGVFAEPAVECEGESEMPAAAATPMAEYRDISPDVGDGDQDEGGVPTQTRKDSKTDASEVNTMLNVPGTSGAKNRSKLPVRSSHSNPTVLLVSTLIHSVALCWWCTAHECQQYNSLCRGLIANRASQNGDAQGLGATTYGSRSKADSDGVGQSAADCKTHLERTQTQRTVFIDIF